jgi:phosphomecalonate degydratase small subunit
MILQGRGISKGKGRGNVLMSNTPVSFLGGVNPASGTLSDPSMNNESVKDRVFAFPRGKGSTVGSYVLLEMRKQGTLPAAMVNSTAEPIVATGAVMAHVPLVDRIDLSLLRNGDLAVVDGNLGRVELPEVKETHVVSCLVRDGDRYLLLKRSEQVGTFQGYWAAVSGYVEPGETPDQTAVKELREETSLELNIAKAGAAVRARSDDTIWVIHPFLFQALGPKVKIDWEHTEFRWLQTDELKGFQTVPGLEHVIKNLL